MNIFKTQFSAFMKAAFISALAFWSISGTQAQDYSNGFETSITPGWDAFGGPFDPTRVASGTNGVTSATGVWHAELNSSGNAATNWGGYNSTFPTFGYNTSLDIYLDVSGGWANDTRFDFTSAINNTVGSHRRDFVFNVGFYDDATGPGANTDRFVVSASNNSGRGNSFPKNPGRSPIAISATGWYTFVHNYYDAGAGVLAVDLEIYDSGGVLVGSWTLSDPSDIIGSTIGGNRYGWVLNNEFSFLSIDNSAKTDVPPPCGAMCPTISQTNANDPSSFDPCSCGDPLNFYDGNGDITYFHDFVEVTSVTGETWEVTAVAGAFTDEGITPVAVTDPLVETPPGSGIYRIDLFHAPGVGFTMMVDRTAGGGPFPLMEGGTCMACKQVPTLGQWGLILLGLLILTFGVVALRKHEPVLSGYGTTSSSSSKFTLPFDKASFGKMLIAVMTGLAVVFAVAVAAFGYEMTAVDVPGSLLAGPMLAYLLHLLIPKKD